MIYSKTFCQRFGNDWVVVCHFADWGGWLDFEIYEIVGYSEHPTYQISFWKKGYRGSSDMADISTDEAEVFMRGHLKWDGDLQAVFDRGICFGGRHDGKKLAELFEHLYDLGLEHMTSEVREDYLK